MRTLANKQHERDMQAIQRRSTMRDNDDLIKAFNLDRRAKSHATLPRAGYTERLYDYHSQLKRDPRLRSPFCQRQATPSMGEFQHTDRSQRVTFIPF